MKRHEKYSKYIVLGGMIVTLGGLAVREWQHLTEKTAAHERRHRRRL